MRLSAKKITSFQKMILSWWPAHRRDLPWRHTRDPYRIMVSEVMLQQTQVLRVIAKYREFIQTFPTVVDLAQASPAQVLRIWKGMGYNRRALYLHKAAKIIVENVWPVIPAHAGIQSKIVKTFDLNNFPKSEKELRKLPGLGTYTARALLVFAFEQEVPLVDTNIRQIITHFFFNGEPQKESVIDNVAGQLIPQGKSWAWHQALMDYGAMELQKVIGKSLPARLDSAKRAGKAGKKVRSGSIPFRETNRFFRGRIIDRLRDGKISEKKLVSELVITYTKPATFIHSIIDSLTKDGLLQRTSHDVLRLPVR